LIEFGKEFTPVGSREVAILSRGREHREM
jgi:hypothetical protein